MNDCLFAVELYGYYGSSTEPSSCQGIQPFWVHGVASLLMSGVPAALIAVNVQPASRLPAKTLIEQVREHVPVAADGLEWGLAAYSRSGAGDVPGHQGGAVVILLQNVVLESGKPIGRSPTHQDVVTWNQDTKRNPTRGALVVDRFNDFAGNWGDIDLPMDRVVIWNALPNVSSRLRFLEHVLLVLTSIDKGLVRKYRPVLSRVQQLVELCQSRTGSSSSSFSYLHGISALSTFHSSGDPCLQAQTFAAWLHTECDASAGIVMVNPHVNYEFPIDFVVLSVPSLSQKLMC